MKFEGQQVNIPIKGIMRAGTDNLCADGAMNEVIGMEYKDGSWLPYKMQEEGVTIPETLQNSEVVKVYLHKVSEDDPHYILITAAGSLWYETARTGDDQLITATYLMGDVKDIEFIGNMLCVSTSKGIRYFAWREGEYEEKSKKIEDIEGISIRVRSGFELENNTLLGVTYNTIYKEIPASNTIEASVIDKCKELLQSNVIAALGATRDKGGLTGYAFGCIAYRKKNGTIVAASNPILLACPMAKFNSSDGGYRESHWDAEYGYLTDDFPKIDSGTTKINQRSSSYSISNLTADEGEKEVLLGDAPNYGCHYRDQSHPFTLQSVIAGRPSSLLVYDKLVQMPQLLAVINTKITPGAVRQDVVYDGERDWDCCAYAAGNGFEYKIESSSVIESLKDLDIESVCFFMTEQVSPFLIKEKSEDIDKMFDVSHRVYPFYVHSVQNDSYTEDDRAGWTYCIARKSEDKIIEELKRLSTFYLVEEKVLEGITETGSWKSIDLSGKLGDNLVVREQLPITAFGDMDVQSPLIDSYNYRLHAYDYVQELFKGYSLPQLGYNSGLGQYPEVILPYAGGQHHKWEIKVNIKDDNGESRVVNYDDSLLEELRLSLSPIITYPDKNAVSFTIRVYSESPYRMSVYEETHEFSHDWGIGASFYIDPELKPIVPSELIE